MKTVSQLSGQNIPFAAKVTWGGVIEVTNAVGGVDVCLASGIRDKYTGIDWPAGTRTIQGIEALQFLRTRHGVGDGSDLGRISNQQQYMSRLGRKLMSEDVLSNPATLYKLATTAVDNITPSQSLTNPLTLVQIALAVKNVPFDEIVFLQYPVLEDPSDPNKVVPNRGRRRGAVGRARCQPASGAHRRGRVERRCRRAGADAERHPVGDARGYAVCRRDDGRDAGTHRDGHRAAGLHQRHDARAGDLLQRKPPRERLAAFGLASWRGVLRSWGYAVRVWLYEQL